MNHITGFAELLNLDDGLAVPQREYAAAIISACGELKNAVLAHLRLIENSLGREERAGQAAAAYAKDLPARRRPSDC